MDDRFYITGGTLPLDADSYVTRRADTELFEYLRRGEFCYVLNTRQVGKSSLMVRVAQSLRAEGVRVVLLDPTGIGVNVTVEEWYDGLLTIIAEQLSLRRELEDFWLEHPRLGPMQRWMQGLEHVALAQSPEPLCIFVDEIDSVQSLPFSADEFFGGIRECYNRRAYNPAFGRLTFCLLGVAAPVDLISDPRITPFNIGRRIELADFTPEEAAQLEQGFHHRDTETQRLHKEDKEKRRKGEEERGRHEEPKSYSSFILHPLSFASPLNRILYWTGGHPYLTQKLCSALAQRQGVPTNAEVDAVCNELFLSRRAQKTDDNLVFARSRLLYEENNRAALLDMYQRILDGRKFRDDATDPLHNALRLSGIVQAVDGFLTVRNRIYARVFDKQWARDNMPGEELRRQKRAYKLGLMRATAAGTLIVSLMAALAMYAFVQKNKAHSKEIQAKNATSEAKKATIKANDLAQYNKKLADKLRISLTTAQVKTRDAIQEKERADREKAHATLLQQVADKRANDASRAKKKIEQQKSALIAQRTTLIQQKYALATTTKQAVRAGVAEHKARQFAEHNRYVSDVQLISQTLREGNTAKTLELLNAHVPGTATNQDDRDQREFTWRFQFGRLHASSTTFEDSMGAPVEMGVITDGGNLLTLNSKLYLSCRNLRTRQLDTPRRVPGEKALLSPDGKLLAASDQTHALCLRDALTLRVRFPLLNHAGEIRHWRFAPNSQWLLIIYTNGEAQVWNAQTGALRYTTRGLQVLQYQDVALMADGHRLVLASSRENTSMTVYDAAKPKITDVAPLSLWVMGQTVTAVACSPNGALVAGGDWGGRVAVWDVDTRMRQGISEPAGRWRVSSLAFSPDNKFLAIARLDNQVHVAAVPERRRFSPLQEEGELREFRSLSGHAAPINFAAWSPDGALVATGSQDNTARLWQEAPAAAKLPLHIASDLHALSPNGRLVAVRKFPTLELAVWDRLQQKQLRLIPLWNEIATAWTFSPDGQKLAVGTSLRRLYIYDLADLARPPRMLTGLDSPRVSGDIYAVSTLDFSRDGRLLAAGVGTPSHYGSHNGCVRVWDTRTWNVSPELPGCLSAVSEARFSPDNKLLAISGFDNKVRVWRTGDRKQPVSAFAVPHLSALNEPITLAFSPHSDTLAVGGETGKITLYTMPAGARIRDLIGHTARVRSLDFAPDGRALASGSEDGKVKLWDTISNRDLCTLSDNMDAVVCVTFSRQGDALLSSSWDGTVRTWTAPLMPEINALYPQEHRRNAHNLAARHQN